MNNNFDSRIEKSKNYCARLFFHDDFAIPKKSKDILSNRPLSSSSFLTQEDETFLFKKMNYLKYKAKRLLDSDSISERRLVKAEQIIEEAKKIRNLIAEFNLRLANQLLKFNISYYKKNSLVDSILSDAYFDIIKSVDYFNWTLGNRFSTYATWVVKKNFFRESKAAQKKSKKTISLYETDASVEDICCESASKLELDYKTHQSIVSILLSMLETGNCSKDQKRQVFIIESYFGLNGKDNCTLEEISNKLGITKERVRQLKEKSLIWLRQELKHLNLEYDSIFESIRY